MCRQASHLPPDRLPTLTPSMAAIPGASTTILRRRSIVLIPIEPNVPKQQQKGLANVSSTLFGECMRGMTRPPIYAESLPSTMWGEWNVTSSPSSIWPVFDSTAQLKLTVSQLELQVLNFKT